MTSQKRTLTARVLIVTSDDQERILSCLTSTYAESIVIDRNNERIVTAPTNRSRKRSSLPPVSAESREQWSKTETLKRRKADLTCVICQGHAFGYNFGQIACDSCKAFFRRNAWQPIETTKCRNEDTTLCDIRHDMKQKCQRCRLLKCFQCGMRKELVLTPEAKSIKERRLEENRRFGSTNTSHAKFESTVQTPRVSQLVSPKIAQVVADRSYQLSETDWARLHYIQQAYLSASRSIASASSVISLELDSDKMSAYTNTVDVQNLSAVRVINFLRQISEFEELKENDRVVLVKHNLNPVGWMHFALTFDAVREIWSVDHTGSSVSADDEAFAEQCKSLFILCYGYKPYRSLTSILHSINDLVHKDPITVQLLMLTMTFLKGLAPMEEQEQELEENERVFRAHAKFADLLFRYLIERFSFDVAVLKIMHIVEVLMKIQELVRDFYQQIRSKIDASYINPLMQSLLHLT